MKSLLAALLLLYSLNSGADLTIFDVRKTLPMSDRDPVYHDYYINGGTESGLVPGQLITVTRKLPLYDNYLNRSAGDLLLKVAKIKIIHVQHGLAVARLVSEFNRETAPLLEDPFIMVGDLLDMATATSESKKNESAASSDSANNSPTPPKPVAQIMVNSIDLSSKTNKPVAGSAAAPQSHRGTALDAPSLQ